MNHRYYNQPQNVTHLEYAMRCSCGAGGFLTKEQIEDHDIYHQTLEEIRRRFPHAAAKLGI